MALNGKLIEPVRKVNDNKCQAGVSIFILAEYWEFQLLSNPNGTMTEARFHYVCTREQALRNYREALSPIVWLKNMVSLTTEICQRFF